MLPIALALALAPVFAIILYFYGRDKYDREPTKLLLKAFGLGLLSVFPAFAGGAFGSYLGFDISPNIGITFVYAFFVVALSEEVAKYLFLRYGLFPNPAFNEPYDGILYSVMVSMGFAAFENVLYVSEGGVGSAILRMFTAVPAHATFGAIMGYYVGMAKFDPKNRTVLLAKGLGIAVFMHGLYDFLLMQLVYEGMFLGAIASLIISIRYSQKAVKMHQQLSPFNPKNSEEMQHTTAQNAALPHSDNPTLAVAPDNNLATNPDSHHLTATNTTAEMDNIAELAVNTSEIIETNTTPNPDSKTNDYSDIFTDNHLLIPPNNPPA